MGCLPFLWRYADEQRHDQDHTDQQQAGRQLLHADGQHHLCYRSSFQQGQQGNAGGQGKTAYPARCEGRQFLIPKIFAGVPFFYLDKTHPKGGIVEECGAVLVRNKYRIKIFNTINFKKSMHYNPFAYIHSEKDILKLVTTLMVNTQGESKGGDQFWEKAEKLLYTALIAYIHYVAPVEEQNFGTLITFLNAMEVREDDETFQNPIDQMFEALEKKEPNHFAVRQYRLYKLAAGDLCSKRLVYPIFR